MKNNFSRFFYIFGTLVFISFFALFCAFAGGAGGWEPKNAPVSIKLKKSDKTMFCGGFVSENFVITCAHIFSNERIFISENLHMNKGCFVHIPKNLYVRYGKHELIATRIYADFSSDVAVIGLDTSFPKAKIAPVTKKTDVYAPTKINRSYAKTKNLGLVSVGKVKKLKLNFSAEKGLSGYPVYDFSGYVNGIICSYDKTNGTSYAVVADDILRAIDEYKKQTFAI